MASTGLGPRWNCPLANDNDTRKTTTYTRNWRDKGVRNADVAQLTTADLPGRANLAWASFPCQDLSEADRRSPRRIPLQHDLALLENRKRPAQRETRA